MAQREEDQLSEMEDVHHLESEIVPNEDRLPKIEESIIMPKIRAEEGYLEKKWIWALNTPL